MTLASWPAIAGIRPLCQPITIRQPMDEAVIFTTRSAMGSLVSSAPAGRNSQRSQRKFNQKDTGRARQSHDVILSDLIRRRLQDGSDIRLPGVGCDGADGCRSRLPGIPEAVGIAEDGATGPPQKRQDMPLVSPRPAAFSEFAAVERAERCSRTASGAGEGQPHRSSVPHYFVTVTSEYQFQCEGCEGEDISKSCGHELTETLDKSENVDGSGSVLVSLVEACRMCGQRRTVTERNGEKIEGHWTPYRFSVSPDPHLGRSRKSAA